jgi:FkbM family methyltransferase
MRETLRRLVRRGRFLKIAVTRRLVIGDAVYTVSAFNMNGLARAAVAQVYEPWADGIFHSIFKIKPGAFIDVGANVGQTFLKVLRIDRNRRYIGFEPQTTGCSFIHQFIMANRLTHHVILPIGLGREEGMASLGLREENDVTASTVKGYRPEGFYCHFQYIPITRGDTVLERLGVDALSLIKVDVEGGELDVLHGLKESLAKFRPYVLFELLPNRVYWAVKKELDDKVIAFRGERHREMGCLLKAVNYTMYKISPGEGLTPAKELLADDKIAFNYISVPDEELMAFQREFRPAG